MHSERLPTTSKAPLSIVRSKRKKRNNVPRNELPKRQNARKLKYSGPLPEPSMKPKRRNETG